MYLNVHLNFSSPGEQSISCLASRPRFLHSFPAGFAVGGHRLKSLAAFSVVLLAAHIFICVRNNHVLMKSRICAAKLTLQVPPPFAVAKTPTLDFPILFLRPSSSTNPEPEGGQLPVHFSHTGQQLPHQDLLISVHACPEGPRLPQPALPAPPCRCICGAPSGEAECSLSLLPPPCLGACGKFNVPVRLG